MGNLQPLKTIQMDVYDKAKLRPSGPSLCGFAYRYTKTIKNTAWRSIPSGHQIGTQIGAYLAEEAVAMTPAAISPKFHKVR